MDGRLYDELASAAEGLGPAAALSILDRVSGPSGGDRVMEQQETAIKLEANDIRTLVGKLRVWGDQLSPAEQVMIGLLLKRLDEEAAVDSILEPARGNPPVPFPLAP